MMSATANMYRGRGIRSSRPSMQLSATTVDVEAEETTETEYTGRFNEPLKVEQNPLF